MNYQIVLFKNKEKKKIINKFITFDNAKKGYENLLKKSENVIFNVQIQNGKPCNYEIALIGKDKHKDPIYLKDSLGRNIKVELDTDEFSIMKINQYNKEELFLDYKTKNKITTSQFINKYLKGGGLKMISKLNNKIVLQNEEKINLFTFKSEDDALRFTEILSTLFVKTNRRDCMIINDYSTIQRKSLYDMLVNNGFSREYLQTYSTAFLLKK
jgi:hypothetical protein